MRKVLIIIFASIALMGCKHDEEIRNEQPLQPVFAGKVSSDMQYVDFMPDIDLDTISMPPSPSFNNNILLMDLNEDNIQDIKMEVFRDGFATYGITFLPLNSVTNEIGFSCQNSGCSWVSGVGYKNCSGSVFAIEFGAKIENNTCKWSITDLVDKDNDSLRNLTYKYKYYYYADTLNWQPVPNQYLGFRFIENTDTLYGWMRLSIVGKAHIVVHDLAYQKR